MVNIHPSSQIGAQAYAAQLRRQYSEEETARAFNRDTRGANRSARQEKSAASVTERTINAGRTPFAPAGEARSAGAKAAQPPVPGNPTSGEITPQPNPPARPLYSSTNREAPNPNAQLRNIRPGTHLNITI